MNLRKLFDVENIYQEYERERERERERQRERETERKRESLVVAEVRLLSPIGGKQLWNLGERQEVADKKGKVEYENSVEDVAQNYKNTEGQWKEVKKSVVKRKESERGKSQKVCRGGMVEDIYFKF